MLLANITDVSHYHIRELTDIMSNKIIAISALRPILNFGGVSLEKHQFECQVTKLPTVISLEISSLSQITLSLIKEEFITLFVILNLPTSLLICLRSSQMSPFVLEVFFSSQFRIENKSNKFNNEQPYTGSELPDTVSHI